MNCFSFEEIELDQKVSFEYEINEEKMQKFREITGDLNPLHCDLNYAKEKCCIGRGLAAITPDSSRFSA